MLANGQERMRTMKTVRWTTRVLVYVGVFGGVEEDRTPDLRIANATLSQLSYHPGVRRGILP